MLILASKSQTRKTLLNNAGLAFSVASAPIDERAVEASLLTEGQNRVAVAIGLAEAKALAVSEIEPQAVVIGCDQTLDFGGRSLHKPRSLGEAVDQLAGMAGASHALHSGVALARGGEIIWSDADTATLTIKPLSRDQIEAIVLREGEALLSSVGGYRLEGPSVRLFSRIAGDYFTILGLPLLKLIAALERLAPGELERRQ